MKAPPFTRENAREFQRRATESRRRNKAARTASDPASAAQPMVDLRGRRVMCQIDAVLDRLDAVGDNDDTRANLTQCLDKLWSMVLPKAGVMRPRSKPARSLGPTTD